MKFITKTILSGALAVGLMTQPMLAQSSAPSSAPSSFAPSSSSAGGLLPYYIALGFGRAFGDMSLRDLATVEDLYGGSNRYLDLIAAWRLYETSAMLIFWQLGLYSHTGTVERVVQPGGAVFSTNGNMKETGAFAGIGAKVPISKDAKHTVYGAASLGYGKRKFDAFLGTFNGTGKGAFVRAEAGVNIDVGNGFFLTPAVAVTSYNGPVISGGNTVWLLRIGTEF